MGDDITIGVTEIVNNIEVIAQPNDQIVDISVIDNADDVTLNITPTVIEINVNKGSSYAKWGTILGTLSDQTDLQDALDLKADLVDGKVPSSQLPSYVDDVIEVANYASLPATGETGKIYITLDNNKVYRWSGSTYIEIAANTAVWGAITGTLSSQTDLQSALNLRVPYTGATSNVNLGEYGLTGGFLALDTTPTSTPTGIGTIYWDSANRTAALIDGDGDTTLQIGQEQRILVHNNTGSTLTDGQVVYVTGSTGNLPSVALASATIESTSAATIGVVTESIANGADGFITTSGIVNGLNTNAFNEGDLLWLGTTAGTFSTTKPISPNHLVLIGYVIKKAGGNGSILVKIQNTQELDECSDVLFSGLANNDLLVYETASALWKNKSLATVLGYTPANDSNVVHKTGNESIAGVKTFTDNISLSKFLSFTNAGGAFIPSSNTHNLFANDGQFTFVNMNPAGSAITQFTLLYPTSNTTRVYQMPNSDGTLALTSQLHNAVTIGTANGLSLSTQVLSLGLASSSTNGALSSTDWNTFNNKQNALSGTGFVKISGTTITYDNNTYALDSSVVKITGDQSISGTKIFSTGISTNTITSNSFIKTGGTSSQFLKGDGSVDSTSYQPLLTNPITGTGTTNYLSKFTGSSTLGNSLIYDNGTNVGIGTTTPEQFFTINRNIGNTTIGLYNSNSFSSNRNWAITSNDQAYGDFALIQSNSLGGNPITDGTRRFYIGASGNVGIGTTAPTSKLHLYDNATVYLDLQSVTASSLVRLKGGGYSGILGETSGVNQWYITGGGAVKTLTMGTDNTERMRITSSGNVGIGTTSPSSKFDVVGSSWVSNLIADDAVGNSIFIRFNTSVTSNIGSITRSGSTSAVSYNTTSDYRLKEDLKNYSGLDLISNIKTYDFKWKNSEDRMYGVIAHELQEVVPYAVNGEKDAEDMQQVDYSKLVPILVQAIQELNEKINKLENK